MRAPRPARESRLTDWEVIQQWAKAEVARLRAEPDTDMWAQLRDNLTRGSARRK